MQSNRVIKIIKDRRSVRSYRDNQIPDNDLSRILEAGLYAPLGETGNHGDFSLLRMLI